MGFRKLFQDLLQDIGTGLAISRCPYSTAWVARLAELDEPIGEQALDWLRAHQLADGSWGARAPLYFHDRLVCTLAAVTAFARQKKQQDRARLQRGKLALERFTNGLMSDPAGETVAFEMIVPTLLSEAEATGILQHQKTSLLNRLARQRAAKLAALPGKVIDQSTTVAFSAEMVGPDGLYLLNANDLQEANGSVAHSPSATAFFLRYVRWDPTALEFLHNVVDNGAVPYVAPIDVFEVAWPLWNLALTEPSDNETLALCQPHLDFLAENWTPGKGIAAVIGFSNLDGDDTALTYEALAQYGRAVDLAGVLHYEESDHFRCYGIEANPSISANIHVLGALRETGLGIQHPVVQKTVRFLRRAQCGRMFWVDKWHASPYYPTSHAVIASAGYDDDLVDSAVHWILETQNADGSWGFYTPTAEETAYCLQALVIWGRHGGHVPTSVLQRGAAWLADRTDPPYPPLWIGKSLYTPVLVVRSAILSALILVEQGG